MSRLSSNQFRIMGMVVSGLLLLLVAWSVQWFLTNYERRYEESRSDVSPMARRNPLLAAERFLSEIGVTAESVSGRNFLTSPPEQSGMILINRFGRDLLPDQQQRLLEWIKDGGHLVLVPTHEWDEDSEEEESDQQRMSLLETFSVRLHHLAKDCDEDGFAADTCDVEKVSFSDANYANPIELNFQRYTILEDVEDQADWVLEGSEGSHLLHFNVGEGWLTVLSDNEMLRNDEIGKMDHALFLALLNGNARNAWLLYSSNMPSLMELIWKHLPQLLIISLIALALWLLSLTATTGPRYPQPKRARRNLLEHLYAAANHAWATDRAASMLQSSRQTIEQQWSRRHPALDHMSQQMRYQWIAEHSGLSESAIQQALEGQPEKVGDFIRTSAIQQKLARAAAGSAEKSGRK